MHDRVGTFLEFNLLIPCPFTYEKVQTCLLHDIVGRYQLNPNSGVALLCLKKYVQVDIVGAFQPEFFPPSRVHDVICTTRLKHVFLFGLNFMDTIGLLNPVIHCLMLVDMLPQSSIFDVLLLDVQVATLQNSLPFDIFYELLSYLVPCFVLSSIRQHPKYEF